MAGYSSGGYVVALYVAAGEGRELLVLGSSQSFHLVGVTFRLWYE